MTQMIRLFLVVESATFFLAALIHMGHLVIGFAHRNASIAESVIAAVLFGGLLLTLFIREWTRNVGIVVQSFALLGTLVGIFTIIVGVGPRTVPDVLYHIAIVVVLAVGIVVARSAPMEPSRSL
ncbi:MAG TPA: hypothetical protein VFT57_00665 [Gemmatimonadaceae bacterium]|jgi:hypothetical protein|nr:hypothetical protein [Gemmatimonadaceae bacterium]